jgi:hypothetical protein
LVVSISRFESLAIPMERTTLGDAIYGGAELDATNPYVDANICDRCRCKLFTFYHFLFSSFLRANEDTFFFGYFHQFPSWFKTFAAFTFWHGNAIAHLKNLFFKKKYNHLAASRSCKKNASAFRERKRQKRSSLSPLMS